jgi:hypothetical protein
MGNHCFHCFRTIDRTDPCAGIGQDKDPENFISKALAYKIYAGKIKNDFKKTVKTVYQAPCLGSGHEGFSFVLYDSLRRVHTPAACGGVVDLHRNGDFVETRLFIGIGIFVKTSSRES